MYKHVTRRLDRGRCSRTFPVICVTHMEAIKQQQQQTAIEANCLLTWQTTSSSLGTRNERMRIASCSGSMVIKSRYCLTCKKRSKLFWKDCNDEEWEQLSLHSQVFDGIGVGNLQQEVQKESKVRLVQGLSRTAEGIHSFANLLKGKLKLVK